MKNRVREIEKLVGYKFKNVSLLQTAFTHSSFANENKIESNERLEFLGDTVLNFVISDILYRDVNKAEGKLSKMRSRIVSEEPLFLIGQKLGFANFLRKGIGERKNPESKAMIADLVEAIIGAIYLDGGIEPAKRFVLTHFNDLVKEIEVSKIIADSKSYLQEKFVKEKIRYKTTKSGEEHQPVFVSKVFVNKVVCGTGTAGTRRGAEQLAASEAIKNIKKV